MRCSEFRSVPRKCQVSLRYTLTIVQVALVSDSMPSWVLRLGTLMSLVFLAMCEIMQTGTFETEAAAVRSPLPRSAAEALVDLPGTSNLRYIIHRLTGSPSSGSRGRKRSTLAWQREFVDFVFYIHNQSGGA